MTSASKKQTSIASISYEENAMCEKAFYKTKGMSCDREANTNTCTISDDVYSNTKAYLKPFD